MTITSILCLCLAALFMWTEKKENYLGAVILKGLASLCFVFVGVMAGNGGQLAKLIVTGLLLGCIADVLLNLRWVFPKKGQLIFLVGILVFLLSGRDHAAELCGSQQPGDRTVRIYRVVRRGCTAVSDQRHRTDSEHLRPEIKIQPACDQSQPVLYRAAADRLESVICVKRTAKSN